MGRHPSIHVLIQQSCACRTRLGRSRVGRLGCWTRQWWPIVGGRENRAFWVNDVPEDLMTPAPASILYGTWAGTQAYMSSFSSRALAGQDLDVAASGGWVVGPYWTPAWGPLPSDPSLAYAYVSGTSMSSPPVAGAAALLAENKGAKLTQ